LHIFVLRPQTAFRNFRTSLYVFSVRNFFAFCPDLYLFELICNCLYLFVYEWLSTLAVYHPHHRGWGGPPLSNCLLWKSHAFIYDGIHATGIGGRLKTRGGGSGRDPPTFTPKKRTEKKNSAFGRTETGQGWGCFPTGSSWHSWVTSRN